MEDLSKITLTWKNASYLLMENPWAYEGMTAAEYEEEERKANSNQCSDDCGGFARLFIYTFIPGTLPLGDSVRTRCWKCGFRIE